MKITQQTPATRRHATRRGTIEYRIDNPAFPSGIWGREHFTLTRHANGDRVLRAFCELDDEPALIRDVIQRVDAEFHPQDCVVRLTEDDLLQPRRDDRLRCLILDEASRADVLYRSGWNVWSSLHPDGRRMFSMMWRTYRELLHQIQKKPMLVVAGRVRVPLRFQMELLATHCLPAIFDKLPMPLENSNDK